jgi:hypothetical protein
MTLCENTSKTTKRTNIKKLHESCIISMIKKLLTISAVSCPANLFNQVLIYFPNAKR